MCFIVINCTKEVMLDDLARDVDADVSALIGMGHFECIQIYERKQEERKRTAPHFLNQFRPS